MAMAAAAAVANVQLETFMSTLNLQRAMVRLSAAVLFCLLLPGVPEDTGREAACL